MPGQSGHWGWSESRDQGRGPNTSGGGGVLQETEFRALHLPGSLPQISFLTPLLKLLLLIDRCTFILYKYTLIIEKFSIPKIRFKP